MNIISTEESLTLTVRRASVQLTNDVAVKEVDKWRAVKEADFGFTNEVPTEKIKSFRHDQQAPLLVRELSKGLTLLFLRAVLADDGETKSVLLVQPGTKTGKIEIRRDEEDGSDVLI